jgi:hypothetical protein
MPRSWQDLARAPGWLAAAAMLTGCLLALGCVGSQGGDAALGERTSARFDDGGAARDACPTWATCSPTSGLAFAGVVPIAVGGSERVRVLDVGATRPSSSDPGTSRRFAASSTGPSTFRVVDVAPPDLVLLGVAPGVAHLRIEEPSTSLLIDTIAIEVERVVETRLFTEASRVVFPERGVAEVASGAVDSLGVALYGASGAQLADDSLVLHGGVLSAPSRGAVEVVVERDAERVSRVMPVVDSATELVVAIGGFVASLGDSLGPVTLEDGDTVAFESGDVAELWAVLLDGSLVVAGAELVATSDDESVLTASSVGRGSMLIEVAGGDVDAGVPLAPGSYETDLHLWSLDVTRTIHVTLTVPP